MMKITLKRWVVGTLILMSMCWSFTLQASSKKVNVGFVVGMPPFVVADSGILVDLVKEALKRSGYETINYEFPSKQFDKDPLGSFEELDIFVGTPLIFRADYSYRKIYEFDNVAVSKKQSKMSIDTIADLKGKYIVAFNNANQHLKEPFTSFYNENLKNWEGYKEVENQKAQFDMLLKNRTEVILLDRSMAYYYAKNAGVKNMEGLIFHEIFPLKNTIYAVGRNQSYVSAITKSLEEMERDGSVLDILKRYR